MEPNPEEGAAAGLGLKEPAPGAVGVGAKEVPGLGRGEPPTAGEEGWNPPEGRVGWTVPGEVDGVNVFPAPEGRNTSPRGESPEDGAGLGAVPEEVWGVGAVRPTWPPPKPAEGVGDKVPERVLFRPVRGAGREPVAFPFAGGTTEAAGPRWIGEETELPGAGFWYVPGFPEP